MFIKGTSINHIGGRSGKKNNIKENRRKGKISFNCRARRADRGVEFWVGIRARQ
jgi:hypothetical protein